MDVSSDKLSSWASILGSAVTLLGLIQSRMWLTAIGVFSITAAITATAYARRERLLLGAAHIRLAGRNLDSLNVANLNRRLNRTLVIQQANQTVVIDGEDLTMVWHYA